MVEWGVENDFQWGTGFFWGWCKGFKVRYWSWLHDFVVKLADLFALEGWTSRGMNYITKSWYKIFLEISLNETNGSFLFVLQLFLYPCLLGQNSAIILMLFFIFRDISAEKPCLHKLGDGNSRHFDKNNFNQFFLSDSQDQRVIYHHRLFLMTCLLTNLLRSLWCAESEELEVTWLAKQFCF